ncbi:MAG: hypothetical protein N838_10450 [Thiohalocapsa sp. PB-PSB1]|nr:MAG: hypothetical protein N838_10450 [Thiohalocapsa sp. PB-PSB1]
MACDALESIDQRILFSAPGTWPWPRRKRRVAGPVRCCQAASLRST